MYVDVLGRVRNMPAPRNPLQPVFEAIVNSFDALDDLQLGVNPRIEIHIERDTQQTRLEDEITDYPIEGFVIEDNGIGFNDANFRSFRTSDTPFKRHRGGKGVGRFLWLKAFGSVSINSTYHDGTRLMNRVFDFALSEAGVEGGDRPSPSNDQTPRTTVHLKDFKKEYEKTCPKKPLTISHRIIQHCLPFFLSPHCPKVYLLDESETICLNGLFDREYRELQSSCEFKVSGHTFNMASLRLRSSDPDDHKMHFLGNHREVHGDRLKQFIPDLNSKLMTDEGDTFAYRAFVSGDYLDAHITPERTAFTLPRRSDQLSLDGDVTLEDIRDSALTEVKSQLEPFLLPLKERRKDRIRIFVNEKAPEYRYITKHDELVEHIPPDLADDALELELHKIHHKLEIAVREQSKEFLNTKTSDLRQYPQYRERYSQFFERLNDVGKANIAKYIIHRRIILGLLENALQQAHDGKYELEEAVHEIVFPLHTTSDEVPYDRQNLWILDEKLSYHFFLASDKRLDTLGMIDVASQTRPDILIFNNPCVFVDQKSEFSSVVIVEFKRPMRTDYSEDQDNPIAQVYGYVRDLRDGKKLDKGGRYVNLGPDTPVYAYIVCDIAPKIKRFCEDYDLSLTPDRNGYFGFNKKLKTYVEVISYDKMLTDSQKRNRVLFEHLQLT